MLLLLIMAQLLDGTVFRMHEIHKVGLHFVGVCYHFSPFFLRRLLVMDTSEIRDYIIVKCSLPSNIDPILVIHHPLSYAKCLSSIKCLAWRMRAKNGPQQHISA